MRWNVILFGSLLLTGLTSYNVPDSANDSDVSWINRIVNKLEVTEYFLTPDHQNNLAITGYFISKAEFDDKELVAVGNYDIFVAKYSHDGKLLWLNQIGGYEPDIAKVIKCDSNGNVYVTGYITGLAIFDQYIVRSRGKFDIFTAKYSSDGQLQWVKCEGAEIISEPDPVKRKKLMAKYSVR